MGVGVGVGRMGTHHEEHRVVQYIAPEEHGSWVESSHPQARPENNKTIINSGRPRTYSLLTGCHELAPDSSILLPPKAPTDDAATTDAAAAAVTESPIHV